VCLWDEYSIVRVREGARVALFVSGGVIVCGMQTGSVVAVLIDPTLGLARVLT